MIIRRGYRYKLKMTPAQEQALLLQAGHARFVWNKCLGMNMQRLQQQQPILWEQELQFWLTRWKQSEEYGFLKEADSQALQQKIKDLARAFKDGFDKNQPNKRLPITKKRGAGDSFRYPQRFQFDHNRVYLPKIGWVRFYRSRDWQGTPKNVTVRRETDGWYISIQTENEIEPVSTATSLLGLDRGIRDFAAMSDGKRKKHAIVVLEALQINNMSKSAKGTKDAPGSNVAQKQGLNRSILDQGWGLFAGMLDYKLAERGGSVLYVPAPYTSQTCPVCGHRDRANRKDKRFRCVACHYENDADVVGAKNIEAAGQALLASPT